MDQELELKILEDNVRRIYEYITYAFPDLK